MPERDLSVDAFVAKNPEWADVPPEAIERTFTYAWWAFSTTLRDLVDRVFAAHPVYRRPPR